MNVGWDLSNIFAGLSLAVAMTFAAIIVSGSISARFVIGCICSAAIVILMIIFTFQRRLIWAGQRANADLLSRIGQHEIADNFRAADPVGASGAQVIVTPSSSVGVFFQPSRTSSNKAPTLVYFHGNGDQIGRGGVYLGRIFAERGLGFFAVEYPGYGVAGGSPSEEAAVTAAEALCLKLEAERGIDRRSIILMGQSIGTGVALRLAARGFGSKLILISPFTCLADMAGRINPALGQILRYFPFFLRDKLDNVWNARHVSVPTLIFHGDRDEVVPFEQGERLAHAFNRGQCRFVQLRGIGHNNAFTRRVFDDIVSFALAES